MTEDLDDKALADKVNNILFNIEQKTHTDDDIVTLIGCYVLLEKRFAQLTATGVDTRIIYGATALDNLGRALLSNSFDDLCSEIPRLVKDVLQLRLKSGS